MVVSYDNLGEEIRLGTASLQTSGANGGLVNLQKLNIRKYAQKPGLSMILVDYMLYVEHNNRKLEMSAEATEYHRFNNWWWKARLGKCYYKMGMLRDAEKQFGLSQDATCSEHLSGAGECVHEDGCPQHSARPVGGSVHCSPPSLDFTWAWLAYTSSSMTLTRPSSTTRRSYSMTHLTLRPGVYWSAPLLLASA